METLGTRAAGFGGAFVAVADDASAVYWNPAGLASGGFFGLLVDGNSAEIAPDDTQSGASRSAYAIALATPPLGLSYYRLRQTATSGMDAESDPGGSADIRVDSLVTHHAGVTLVQSLAEGIAVGATLKVVRGIAASGIAVDTTRDDLLDHDDLIGRASNKVDADVGIMATLGALRAGLSVRNVSEPEFQPVGAGAALKLDRQVRAGVAFLPVQNWLMAIDVDLTRQQDPFGETRNFATGLEGRLPQRATLRGGFRVNTVGDSGHRPVYSIGGSYAVFGSTFVDAQITAGSEDGDHGWGVAGRVLF
jgi:F plasmid transfer operon, TraF, protein